MLESVSSLERLVINDHVVMLHQFLSSQMTLMSRAGSSGQSPSGQSSGAALRCDESIPIGIVFSLKSEVCFGRLFCVPKAYRGK